MVNLLGGVLLGLVGFLGVALAGKYTGAFDLFAMLWKFVQTLIDFFMQNIPKPMKVLLFISVFLLMGGVLYSWSFGLPYVCDNNDNVWKGETIIDGAKVKLFELFATDSISSDGGNYSFKTDIYEISSSGSPLWIDDMWRATSGTILRVMTDLDDTGGVKDSGIIDKKVKLYFCRNDGDNVGGHGCVLRAKGVEGACFNEEDVVGDIVYEYVSPKIPTDKGTFILKLDQHSGWLLRPGSPELTQCVDESPEYEELYGAPTPVSIRYFGYSARQFSSGGVNESDVEASTEYTIFLYNVVFNEYLNFDENSDIPVGAYALQSDVKRDRFTLESEEGKGSANGDLMWHECVDGDLHLVVAGLDVFDRTTVLMLFFIGVLFSAWTFIKRVQ